MAFIAPTPVAVKRSSSINYRCPTRLPPSSQAETPAPYLLERPVLDKLLQPTMLSSKPLALVYSSAQHSFSNDAFFSCLIPLGGVPSLVLARSQSGLIVGGYAASGFLARDDYREASTPDSMFVFRLEPNNQISRAINTDPVQYDFYDYAIRFGAGLLGIPMNPAKHTMASNMATSSCLMPNGDKSLFGEYTLTKLDVVQVLVAKQYVDELEQNKVKSPGFFRKLFG